MSPQLLPEHKALLRKRIVELGLQDFNDRILNGSYSGYLLVGDRQAASRQVGTSRFGGDPDMPRKFDAAILDPLVFIYQVRMADLPHAKVLGLPDTGLLSVFSDSAADFGTTFFFDDNDLVRHCMPAPDPEYIFANMKPWKFKVTTSVEFPEYGEDVFYEIQEAGLESEYEEFCHASPNLLSGRYFGQILGRFSSLNGDMREDAAKECGGQASDWLSLWKVFSSFDSGLVISDFHLLHGMVRKRDLKRRNFSRMYSTSSNG